MFFLYKKNEFSEQFFLYLTCLANCYTNHSLLYISVALPFSFLAINANHPSNLLNYLSRHFFTFISINTCNSSILIFNVHNSNVVMFIYIIIHNNIYIYICRASKSSFSRKDASYNFYMKKEPSP